MRTVITQSIFVSKFTRVLCHDDRKDYRNMTVTLSRPIITLDSACDTILIAAERREVTAAKQAIDRNRAAERIPRPWGKRER